MTLLVCCLAKQQVPKLTPMTSDCEGLQLNPGARFSRREYPSCFVEQYDIFKNLLKLKEENELASLPQN